MTTRSITPRSTGEGKLGEKDAHWGDGYIDNIYAEAIEVSDAEVTEATIGKLSLGGAVHEAKPVTVTSVSGVVTLTEASNSFIVKGSESVTSITGWTAGSAKIRWDTARTLTHNDESLILQGDKNRVTAVGDVGVYEFTAAGAREVNYFPATASEDLLSFPLGVENYIASGIEVSGVSNLAATLTSGTAVISNTPVAIDSSSVTLPVRTPNLIYGLADGSVSYVSGAIPTSYIDNYTVGFWNFNVTTSGAVIPNSAYGVSSSAVANDLTPTGGISSVDGWADYGLKLDGTTGYFTGANTTNFPSTTSEREVNVLFTVNKLNTSTYNTIFSYGALSTGNMFGLSITAAGYFMLDGYSTNLTTTFLAEVGKTYLATLQYDGTYGYLYINGALVYKGSWGITTTLTYSMFVGAVCGSSASQYSYCTVHFLELRTKMRSAAKLGAMANSLMLPCFYTKSGATAPTVPSAYSSSYHEYLFSESSGTSVADSNTTSALTGAAANTTAAQTSDIGLTYSRLFSSGYVSVGSFAVASTFTYIGVVNISSYSTARCLWSNRPSGGTGVCLYINTSGYLCYISGTTTTVLTSTPITTGSAIFIAVTVNGTTATVYMNSGQKTVTAVVTTPSTTSAAAYIGYDVYGSLYMTGKYDYCMFVNSELSQAEIKYYYTELMATGRRFIIDDMLPSNCVSLAFARTNSNKIIEYNDTDYMYGRREKATGGNRKVFLGWKYYNGTAVTFYWDNPFGTRKIKTCFTWALDANGSNESETGQWDTNGVLANYPSQQKIGLWCSGGVCYFNSTWQSTGYIGCYAEVLEDAEGV